MAESKLLRIIKRKIDNRDNIIEEQEAMVKKLMKMNKNLMNKERAVLIERIEKILISLAYQKIDGKLKRVDIDHRKVMERIDKEAFKE